ncbi:MAG: histidine phosphatase family protein [Armatimonadota bacterium]
MITVYLVRHGESVYNCAGRIQGQQDVPLSQTGIKQAMLLAKRLESTNISAVYASDLERATSTARIIATQLGLEVETTPLLRESKLGIVEGLTKKEVEKLYPAELHKWRRDPQTARPPGAESISDVISRSKQFLEYIVPRHEPDSHVLIVGHSGSIRGLIVAALNLPEHAYRALLIHNASISVLEVSSRSTLCLLNDTCHLDTQKGEIEEDENDL